MYHLRRTILILFALLLATIESRAEGFRFPYIVEVKDSADMQLSDSVFYRIARSVIFPVNKYNIPEDSEFYHELVDEVIPEMNAHGYRLESIAIRGAASPEGPYGWNEFLGQQRLRALYKLIDSNMNQPSCPDCLHQVAIPEDYNYLLYMMAEANDPDYDRVKTYVDRYRDVNVEILKQRLMNLDGGMLWKRLLATYYPELRAARVVLFFRHTLQPIQPVDINYEELLSATNAYRKIAIELDTTAMFPSGRVQDTHRIPRRELLSVKTNLLFDLAYMPFGYKAFCPIPNIAIEYYPLHGHFTYGAMFDCPWWQGGRTNHKYFQVRNYTLETRYYFRNGDVRRRPAGQGAAYRGCYLSAYAHAFLYGIGWSDNKGFDAPGSMGGHGWMGEGAGAGLGIGYVMPLGQREHWRLEFSAQFGYFRTKYDPYIYGCPVEHKNDGKYYYVWYRDADEFQKRQYHLNWFGPTRVAIQLSYDILYRRIQKRGASFRAWEGGEL